MFLDELECAPVSPDDILNEVSPQAIDWDALAVSSDTRRDLFAPQKRVAWDKSVEARCDFTPRLRLTRRADVCFVSLWKKSLYGPTLTEIKADDRMVLRFAEGLASIAADVLGHHLPAGQWAVCTTPKRRHLTRNFATLIAMEMAGRLDLPFYEDAAHCHSKHRVGAVFTAANIPSEPNVIVIDDFVTTGSTLRSMQDLLRSLGKNTAFFAGINNSL